MFTRIRDRAGLCPASDAVSPHTLIYGAGLTRVRRARLRRSSDLARRMESALIRTGALARTGTAAAAANTAIVTQSLSSSDRPQSTVLVLEIISSHFISNYAVFFGVVLV